MKFLVALCCVLLVGPVAGGSNEAGKAFLEANAKLDGVISLPSGLQYKVLSKGTGSYHPTRDSQCSCHYHGTLVDGSTFDSSYDRGQPIDFAPTQVISGWTEAMQMMVEGDKWELYVPSDLGYGDRGSPPKIGGGDTLVFIIELLEIKGDKVPAYKCLPSLEGCNDKEKTYIAKQLKATDDEVAKQLARLQAMEVTGLKPDLADWVIRRVKILSQWADFKAAGATAANEEL